MFWTQFSSAAAPVTVLKYENRCLVHFDGEILSRCVDCVVHICLLASRDATIDGAEHAPIQHLEKHHPRSRVQCLHVPRHGLPFSG